MTTLSDGQIDPRAWAGELAREDLATIIRLELERARVEATPPPKPPSPWTPKSVGALLTTLGTVLTTIIVGLSQVTGASERDEERTRAAISEYAAAQGRVNDEITKRLLTAEERATWAAAGVCALNGAPLHQTQPAECVATVQRDPVKVPKAYP